MTHPEDILADLRRRGFFVRATRGRIGISPSEDVTKDVRELVLANREALLEILNEEARQLGIVDTWITSRCIDDPPAPGHPGHASDAGQPPG
jgi:hypothetical protein